nr:MAG TPA: hypothetical protein [Caudoviricetes sp.]
MTSSTLLKTVSFKYQQKSGFPICRVSAYFIFIKRL